MAGEQTSSTGITRFLKKVGDVINFLEVFLLSAGTAALTALLIANVIARHFFRSLYFAEEVSEMLIIVITFMGVSYAVRKARHIRMGAIFDAIGNKSTKVQKVMIIIIAAYSGFIMFAMARYSLMVLMGSMLTQQTTTALNLPYWLMYIFVVAGFFLAGVQYIRTIYTNLKEEEVWLSPEQQGEYEDEG